MNRLSWIAASVLALNMSVATAAVVPIDLNTWSKRGPAANGNWVVAAGGASVLQTINNDPTFFVGSTNQINTTLRGKIRVEQSGGDDDLIGFVMGFNAPLSTGNDMDYLLFDWKQGSQSSGGVLSNEGFALSRVQGTITNYLPGFWGRADSAGFDNLANRYGATEGWADNVEYDFTILYQTNRVKIDIAGGAYGAGATIFDLAGNFSDGRFGFYNYSQASVRYSGLTEEATPPPSAPVSLPGTLTLVLLALGLGAVQVRRHQTLS